MDMFFLALLLLVLVSSVSGHGRLTEPPSRSTMWRYGFKTPPNYSDNQLFCGGVGVQYSSEVNGRCGICGDPFNGLKENEAGGKYAKGIIVRSYNTGQILNIEVQFTANHKGWTEFKICPNNDVTKRATQDCLDRYPLERADGNSGTRFPVTSDMIGVYTFPVKLPQTLSCSQCVLQWRYHAGNSWGTDPDGTSCVGCGNQEEFYGCADISIVSSGTVIPATNPDPAARVPAGNDPNMTDYEDWDWDTVPPEYVLSGTPTIGINICMITSAILLLYGMLLM